MIAISYKNDLGGKTTWIYLPEWDGPLEDYKNNPFYTVEECTPGYTKGETIIKGIEITKKDGSTEFYPAKNEK